MTKLHHQRRRTTMTKIHRMLIKFVEDLKLSYRVEEQFGNYFVDVYLPEFHVGLEADGPYHFKKRDKNRDKEIWDNSRLPILRIDEKLLTHNHQEEVQTDIVDFIETYGRQKTETSEDSLYWAEAYRGDDH